MSTKIYTAYKLKKYGDLWPLVRDIHRRGKREAQQKIRACYASLGEAAKDDADRYKKLLVDYAHHGEDAERLVRLTLGHELMMDLWRGQRGRPERSSFDFRAEIAVHEWKKGIYLRPMCGDGLRGCLDFLRHDPRLVDFAYWNNSDRPEDVSARAWSRRGSTWRKMERSLAIISVVSEDNFIYVDPFFNDAYEDAEARGLAKARGRLVTVLLSRKIELVLDKMRKPGDLYIHMNDRKEAP